jgi:hypothetical protein
VKRRRKGMMQGRFVPKHPEKYKGNPTNIFYRSSWEFKYMMFLDTHPEILQWSSEEIVIPYRSPKDQAIHRYFPDFWIKKKNEICVVEIKPYVQTQEPTVGKKRKVTLLKEAITYAVNQAKWEAATDYCLDRGWKFIKMTEKGVVQ